MGREMDGMRTIQPYDLMYEKWPFAYIKVHEGSDLLDVTIDAEGTYIAWCVVDTEVPMTRRFFRIMMPGSRMPQNGDALRFISSANDGGMVWLVFEDEARKQEYLREEYG